MKFTITATLAAALFGLFASTPGRAEDSPSRLSCTFRDGTAGSYEAGEFKSKPPQALEFSVEKMDLEGQKATITAKGAGSEGKLSIVRAINANHFLEVVNEGFLNITTIYDKDPATGLYPALHSRHIGILGQPVFAQYTGACREQ